ARPPAPVALRRGRLLGQPLENGAYDAVDDLSVERLALAGRNGDRSSGGLDLVDQLGHLTLELSPRLLFQNGPYAPHLFGCLLNCAQPVGHVRGETRDLSGVLRELVPQPVDRLGENGDPLGEALEGLGGAVASRLGAGV